MDSGATPQYPPPPDQLYADAQIANGDAPAVSAGDVQPQPAVDDAAIVSSTPTQDPLAPHYG